MGPIAAPSRYERCRRGCSTPFRPSSNSGRDLDETAYLSAVGRIELIPGWYLYGACKQIRAERLEAFLEEVEELPFTSREVEGYEQIIAQNGFSRRLIVDRMIAAMAVANDLALATLNARDFRDIRGLIEDWS